jgi:hypothetical protein
MSDNKVLATAKNLVAQGISVYPAWPRSKEPVKSWTPYKKRLPIGEELVAWFKPWPDNNLAVISGGVSGNLIVLDIDGGCAASDLDHFCNKYGINSWTVATSRGYHIYLRVDVLPVVNVHVVIDGIDIDVLPNGSSLVPPSIHPSGTIYATLREWNRKIQRVGNLEDILGVDLSTADTLKGNTSTGYSFSSLSGLNGVAVPDASNNHPQDVPLVVRDATLRKSLIGRIKARLPILEFISGYTAMQPSQINGSHYSGKCFMHNDTHTSLSLDTHSNRAWCFSTQCCLRERKGYDVLDLYGLMYKTDLWGTCMGLAQLTGISL